jgi:hypothetical protein
VDNTNAHHIHVACNPIIALGGNTINVMVVGGIGPGAIMKLNAMGVKVYRTGATSASKNIVLPNEVIPQTLFTEKMRMAAFLDEKFGIMGGAGDPGKAHYTSDGGKTWKEESVLAGPGASYISRDGKFLTVNLWGKGVTLLKYE